MTTAIRQTNVLGSADRWVDEGVEAARRGDEAVLERIAREVRELTRAFPAPGILA